MYFCWTITPSNDLCVFNFSSQFYSHIFIDASGVDWIFSCSWMHFNLRYLPSPRPTDAVICTWKGNSHTCYANTKCFRSISIRVWLHDAAPGRLWNTSEFYVYKVKKTRKNLKVCARLHRVWGSDSPHALNAQISPLFLAEITHRGASLIWWLHAWVHVSIKGEKNSE